MSDSEFEYPGVPVPVQLSKKQKSPAGSKRKATTSSNEARSDSELEYPVQLSRKPKSPAGSKRKASSSNEEAARSTTKKKPAGDLFAIIRDAEKVAKTCPEQHQLGSSIVTRVASGHVRRAAPTEGEFYVELKVYNTVDAASTTSQERWKKALVTVRLQADQDTPHWEALQKFMKSVYTLFEDTEPTFYGEKIN
ncbi:hypothetical protein JYU34_016647, partial [Plutella xylostella]